MPAFDPEPLLAFEPSYPFRNKHKNFEFTAARLYNAWNRTSAGAEPPRQRWRAGLNALRRIVLAAEAENKRVRAYGGAWSLSPITECRDFLVNTKPLNYVSIGLAKSQVLSPWAGKAGRLVFAQCGLHVMELHNAVEGAGLALPTSGASNGQTIAGAIATGTHGAAWTYGSMQEAVRGIHLVVDRGRHVYLEPASAPVVSKAFANTLGAELVRDDALFYAALVSFGSFGLVHALLLETVPIYELVKHRFRADHSEALGFTDLDFTRFARARRALPPAMPYHFEIVVNPYRARAGQKGAYVTAMYRVPGGRASRDPSSSGGLEPGDDALSVIAGFTDVAPSAIPALATQLIDSGLPLANGERATPARTFGSTSIRGNIVSSELGVALADSRRAIENIVDVARGYPFPGLIATRFVKASPATLAFTRFSPITCTIELPGAGSARSLEFYSRVFRRLDREQIAFTLHWGQWGDFSKARLAAMYGGALDSWRAARRKLLTPKGRKTFSNAFLEACGLAD